jgi:hypothetical protein
MPVFLNIGSAPARTTGHPAAQTQGTSAATRTQDFFSTRNFSSDSRPGTLSGPTQHISGEFSFDSEHELTGFINHG